MDAAGINPPAKSSRVAGFEDRREKKIGEWLQSISSKKKTRRRPSEVKNTRVIGVKKEKIMLKSPQNNSVDIQRHKSIRKIDHLKEEYY